MKANFSLEETGQKEIEESVMDTFHFSRLFFISLEDQTNRLDMLKWCLGTKRIKNGDGGSDLSSTDRMPTEEFQALCIIASCVY